MAYRFGVAWVSVTVDNTTPQKLFSTNATARTGIRARTVSGTPFYLLLLPAGSTPPVNTDFTNGACDYAVSSGDTLTDWVGYESDVWVLSAGGNITVKGRQLF